MPAQSTMPDSGSGSARAAAHTSAAFANVSAPA